MLIFLQLVLDRMTDFESHRRFKTRGARWFGRTGYWVVSSNKVHTIMGDVALEVST